MKKLSNLTSSISAFFIGTLLTACGEPEQRFKVEVVDEVDNPMEGVEVSAWFNLKGKDSPLDSYKVTAATGSDGTVELQGETVWYQTSVSAQPEGYYKSMKYGHWTLKQNGNRWEPWPVEVDLVLKKIGDPHPMYVAAKTTDGRFLIPKGVIGPIGFDLLERDWVAPNGKGKRTDIILEGVREKQLNANAQIPPGYVHLTFPNPGDGVFPVREESGGSFLVGSREAPVAGYLEEWKFANSSMIRDEAEKNLHDISMFVFRIRTELDPAGGVESAFYGKLPEGIWFSGGSVIRMTYYLNELPGDRRLEWDMKNNLFKDITSGSPHRP